MHLMDQARVNLDLGAGECNQSIWFFCVVHLNETDLLPRSLKAPIHSISLTL